MLYSILWCLWQLYCARYDLGEVCNAKLGKQQP